MPTVRGRAVDMTDKRDEPLPFDWAALVSLVVHPMRVEIIETLRWTGEPLSASDLTRIFGIGTLSVVSYHVRELAKAGVLKEISTRQVRGARETFYFFPRRK
jgi:DNA-binding transcriptional ArsR family regulator